MNSKITCICGHNFSEVLTYGRKYELLELDEGKKQVRVLGDNNRKIWFPLSCFDLTGADAPVVDSIWIEAECWLEDDCQPSDANSDMILSLSDGSRWVASFYTYENLIWLAEKNKRTGECMSGKYFWATDMIFVDEISRKRIEEVVRHVLEQNEFKDIFREIEPDDDK